MHALPRVLCLTLVMVALIGCGSRSASLQPGQAYKLAPDMTVRLASSRPSRTQLELQLTIDPVGSTPAQALVPSVVVIPAGGQETSASLDFPHAQAVITMLLDNAQHVDSVTVRDARSGRTVNWAVLPATSLLACKPGDDCQLIGVPHSQAVPGHP